MLPWTTANQHGIHVFINSSSELRVGICKYVYVILVCCHQQVNRQEQNTVLVLNRTCEYRPRKFNNLRVNTSLHTATNIGRQNVLIFIISDFKTMR